MRVMTRFHFHNRRLRSSKPVQPSLQRRMQRDKERRKNTAARMGILPMDEWGPNMEQRTGFDESEGVAKTRGRRAECGGFPPPRIVQWREISLGPRGKLRQSRPSLRRGQIRR